MDKSHEEIYKRGQLHWHPQSLHSILLLRWILSKGLLRWNICHQTFDNSTYQSTHRESTGHNHGHPIWGSTNWSIFDCTVHPTINGLSRLSPPSYLHSPKAHDRDRQRRLRRPWLRSWSPWANDSPRDTWHSKGDHQRPCERADNQASCTRSDPTLANQAKDDGIAVGTGKER